MTYDNSDFALDIARVSKIEILPSLLDVICQTTGMGFAAVARVTQTRWVTCSVRDDINFGLVPGSELRVETTICNEIRDAGQAVVIDHVTDDPAYCNHHTPAMYGFESYISYPIFLKSGAFFGTLCAIDPRPAQLDNSKIRGLFVAFADLISFHLQQAELLEQSDHAVRNLSRQLTNSLDENRQFQHISSHTLQEPLRKLRTFSGMLIDALNQKQLERAEHLALRIESGASKFSNYIRDLSDFSSLQTDQSHAQQADLEYIVGLVSTQLRPRLEAKGASVHIGMLPVITGIPDQLEQLFLHLFENAIKFSKAGVPLQITVDSVSLVSPDILSKDLQRGEAVQIQVTDNGIGIENSQLEKIFDIFSQLAPNALLPGEGIGLSICRKIVRNHSGQIAISSKEGVGTTVLITLPTGHNDKEHKLLAF